MLADLGRGDRALARHLVQGPDGYIEICGDFVDVEEPLRFVLLSATVSDAIVGHLDFTLYWVPHHVKNCNVLQVTASLTR